MFTISNYVNLYTGGEFKYQTPDEEIDEFEEQIEYYKKKGYFN